MFPIKTARFPVCQNVVAIRTDLVDRSLDREHLIAEEMVTDDYSASLLADRFNEFLKIENNLRCVLLDALKRQSACLPQQLIGKRLK